jgi:hypothetical protein
MQPVIKLNYIGVGMEIDSCSLINMILKPKFACNFIFGEL